MGAYMESSAKHPLILDLGNRFDEYGQILAPVAFALSERAEPSVHVDVAEKEIRTCPRWESSSGSQICHYIS